MKYPSSNIIVPPRGQEFASVLVVGDFPSSGDERKGMCFSDSAGLELMKMLEEAGFDTATIRFMNVLNCRPYASQLKYVWSKEKKDATIAEYSDSKHSGAFFSPSIKSDLFDLATEINRTKPRLIIALGDLALWALAGENSVSKFRGSLETLQGNLYSHSCKVIATYAPAQILKMWDWRWLAVRDLQRAFSESHSETYTDPDLRIKIAPTFIEAEKQLEWLIEEANKGTLKLSSDVETISRHISCLGLAWSSRDALVIPFVKAGYQSFYTLEEEVRLVWLISVLHTHPNVRLIGQNFSYDIQHMVRSWLMLPVVKGDTMLMQHAILPGTPKDLSTLASLYCLSYEYWKDELTDYRTLPDDLEKFWLYNGKDVCYTFEIHEALESIVNRLGFTAQSDFLHRLNAHVIRMMVRGVAIDQNEKQRLILALQPEIEKRQTRINYLAGRELNISSPKQMSDFFYNDLKMKVVRNRKTYQPTTDKTALTLFGQREPILKPLTDLIEETRSIGVFMATFVMMPLDVDKRMRCNYNVGGTETFRFSSSQNAFGSGGNLQNIPKGSEDEELSPGAFFFPNLRKMFIPDPSFTLFDVDLAGADAQVVAWEAEDEDLKAKFRSGEKIHALNAKDMYGTLAGPDGKRAPYYKYAKMGGHLTNYGGGANVLSKSCGMTIHEAETFQKRWFSLHPGIKTWHEETLNNLFTKREVRNKFGFRRYFFDRIEGLLPEALAWIPQSTVALIINKALCQISEHPTLQKLNVQLLMQVHDSLVGQFPSCNQYLSLPIIRQCLRVTVPYDDPLVIGTSLDLSEQSWGDLVAFRWEQIEE